MPDTRPTVIFDTSALNALADESEANAIATSLGIGWRVRLSETCLSEVGATKTPARRETLLELCRRLQYSGECIRPYNWIIETLTLSHARNPDDFDWRAIDLRGPEIEEQIARPTLLGTDSLAEEIRADFKAKRSQFESIHADARARFPLDSEEQLPSLLEVIELERSNGALWKHGASLYGRASDVQIDEEGICGFISKCPPFHALLVSFCVAQFHRCVRDLRATAEYNAGMLDLMMSVYLPYCKVFVTNDEGQSRALDAIANEIGISTRVQPYKNFVGQMLVC